MNIQTLVSKALNKTNFITLQNFIDFTKEYLDFISHHLQAVIVSQNEHHYNFYQYDETGNFQITRPINADLMYNANTFELAIKKYMELLPNLRDIKPETPSENMILNKVTYTLQQSIGAALDAIGGGKANTTRKLNGDLFERLMDHID